MLCLPRELLALVFDPSYYDSVDDRRKTLWACVKTCVPLAKSCIPLLYTHIDLSLLDPAMLACLYTAIEQHQESTKHLILAMSPSTIEADGTIKAPKWTASESYYQRSCLEIVRKCTNITELTLKAKLFGKCRGFTKESVLVEEAFTKPWSFEKNLANHQNLRVINLKHYPSPTPEGTPRLHATIGRRLLSLASLQQLRLFSNHNPEPAVLTRLSATPNSFNLNAISNYQTTAEFLALLVANTPFRITELRHMYSPRFTDNHLFAHLTRLHLQHRTGVGLLPPTPTAAWTLPCLQELYLVTAAWFGEATTLGNYLQWIGSALVLSYVNISHIQPDNPFSLVEESRLKSINLPAELDNLLPLKDTTIFPSLKHVDMVYLHNSKRPKTKEFYLSTLEILYARDVLFDLTLKEQTHDGTKVVVVHKEAEGGVRFDKWDEAAATRI